MKLKIIIADDHKLFREMLTPQLLRQQDMEVVAETFDGSSTFQMAIEKHPDIILMDISMPGLNGIEATRKILTELPEIRIIILSMHSDQRFVVESLKAGVRGYVLKDSSVNELLTAIRSVAKDQIFLSKTITDQVVKDYIQLASLNRAPNDSLSGREREVLQLLAEGWSMKEIAGKLNVSIKTIETYRKQIMDKLNLYTIAELTKFAIREGLTSLE